MNVEQTLDIEPMLAPLDEEAPSGSDLEYDPQFMALERLATPKEERAVGDSVIPAEEPEWAKVEEQALALLQRSRDLRLAVHLCEAGVRLRGIPGWADGLGLVRGLLERQWESVHPQLDAEDENDPTARVNAILPLADVRGALGYLRSTPFVQSAMLGRFTLRDLKAANGTLRTAEEETKPASLGDIEACCLDCPLEQLEQSKVQSAQALEHARAIDALLMDRLGVDSPELKPLIDDLQELDKFLQPQWAARSGVMVDADAGSDGEGVAAAANGGVAATGKIGGRADVVRRIDELCNYYSANEPSSPVPILLRRARGLVGKGFEEILQDLAPGGVTEMQVFVGSGSGEE